VKAAELVRTENVAARNAVKTRQFWLIWIAPFCLGGAEDAGGQASGPDVAGAVVPH
jgi:hypothetical protein